MYREIKSDLIKQNEVSKEYAIDVVSDGNVYCYLPIDQNVVTESSIKVSVNGKHITTMFGENVWGENGIVYLGSYKKVQRFMLIMKVRILKVLIQYLQLNMKEAY